jgi:hypothetical protein
VQRTRFWFATNRLTASRSTRSCGAKPSSSKGRYLKKIVVSTTTGPGIPVDPAVTRHFTEG